MDKKDRIAKWLLRCIVVECAILVMVLAVYAVAHLNGKQKSDEGKVSDAASVMYEEDLVEAADRESISYGKEDEQNQVVDKPEQVQSLEDIMSRAQEEQKVEKRKELLNQAQLLARGYDYDAAIALIQAYEEDYTQFKELRNAVEEYEKEKEGLVLYGAYSGVDQISHIFFHSLIVDPSKAFDGDHMANGYNYWMTTVDEFNRMMESMYEDGYVLVSIHDVAHEVEKEDGLKVMKPGEILLPKDKKPFVLSQDDVNFYEYMKKDGFAKRIVIDENGYPACEMEKDGVTTVARDYDVVPLLEKFIEEHPDFSYRGARGIIGCTGYEGVMGYRTNEKQSKTYEEDLKQAKETARRLRELGWEFASHSYGHGHMGKASVNELRTDSNHWDQDVASIIGDTDIYLFPYGEDIQEGVGKYKGEKYEILSGLGFKYYCGVYAYPWIQINDSYVRMTRRNLDGFTMHFHPDRLKDLFHVEEIMDSTRPAFQ